MPIALLVIWEVAVRSGWLPPSFSAAPSTIAVTCVKLLFSGQLAKHALLSVLRMSVGVLVGGIIGVGVGIAVGQSRAAESLLSPMLQFIAPVPVIVWMPFLIMLLGTGELYKVSLPAFATFLLVYIHTFRGVRSVQAAYLEIAEVYEKTRWQRIWHIFLPAALPSIITGLRIALAINWIVIFFVEYTSAAQGLGGLGWFIHDAREVGRIEDQFAGIVVLGIIGVLSEVVVTKWQTKKLAWRASLESALAQAEHP